jgi:hypothetical protein
MDTQLDEIADGPTFTGDGGGMLRSLADAYEERLHASL